MMPPIPDHGRSERVWSIAERLAPEVSPNITWMSAELIDRLLQVFEATRAIMLIHMVKAGLITQQQAQEATPEQIFLMAFHVGFECGREFEDQDRFNQMWGETPPPDV